ncbi:hypothetical protein E2C01_005860 [Portunus trituberculatus]|uniref:Uncharacterized protein n=1 Tax=Portunus trituberculatus TaxID=210409 RepID=A0A5B7CUK0_PORTR|nr:hypothetical protein [Portunus trituberculatus]
MLVMTRTNRRLFCKAVSPGDACPVDTSASGAENKLVQCRFTEDVSIGGSGDNTGGARGVCEGTSDMVEQEVEDSKERMGVYHCTRKYTSLSCLVSPCQNRETILQATQASPKGITRGRQELSWTGMGPRAGRCGGQEDHDALPRCQIVKVKL